MWQATCPLDALIDLSYEVLVRSVVRDHTIGDGESCAAISLLRHPRAHVICRHASLRNQPLERYPRIDVYDNDTGEIPTRKFRQERHVKNDESGVV